MSVNKINQLAVATGFTPTSGAVSSGDNAQLALEKLQGAKANLVATPTANRVLLTNSNGQPIQSPYLITTDETLPDGDLATTNAIKKYVATYAQGIQWKAPCTVASIGSISLSGLSTVDGYSLNSGDRVLVRLQTNATENGIYIASSGSWSRSSDASEWYKIVKASTLILNGTNFGGDGFTFTVPATGVIGTNPITIEQFSEGTAVKAGSGIEVSSNNTVSLSDEYIFSVNTTAVTKFSPAVQYQYFSGAVALDATTMMLGKRYTFTAQGASVAITLSEGVFRGFTVLGTTTKQTLNDGESFDFILVKTGIVQIV